MSSELELAHFVNHIKYNDLPAEVVKATKRDIFDTIGVGLSGSQAPGISQMVDYAKEMGGKESGTILVSGFKAPPVNVALVNGGMCHARDYDDTHDTARVHTGAAVIPAALAVAEHIGGVSGKELINAVTLGIEIHCRLGLTNKFHIGWALPALYGYFGAATAAGKLLGLDVEGMLNAWGIAYSQAAGNLETLASGGLTKRLQLGFAASAGVLSGLLAQKGITGAKNSFEGKAGIFQLYQRGEYEAAPLTEALGKGFEVTNLSFKPYPCDRGSQSGIDAALEIARKYNISPEQIAEVRVRLGSHTYEVCGEPIEVKRKPRNVVDAQFSTPYTVACALVRKKVDLSDFTDESIKDRAVLKVASQVYPIFDPEIDRELGKAIPPTQVEVQTKSGEVYSAKVIFAKGHPKNPMTDEEFEAKFRSCATSADKEVSPKIVNNLMDRLNNLEQVADIRQITSLFCPVSQ